ncbi:hypothetical protein DRO97_02950 [Archaeoglobales archaeon]|nr:MAG: hypothetical protein DRO97_02950 [Archaeoglobales archaeon]
MKLKGRTISKGYAEGEAVVSTINFSFLGDVDVESGVIVADDSNIKEMSIKNKIFVFPSGRGSTVGTYILLRMKKINTAPKAIINIETEPIIAVGAIIAEIPLLDKLMLDNKPVNPLNYIKSGDYVKVNATEGWVEINGD